MPDDPDANTVVNLMAAVVAVRSEVAALRRMCEEIARAAGVKRLDGLPPADWFGRQRLAELQRALENVEDMSPALAAALQQSIDQARGEGGADS